MKVCKATVSVVWLGLMVSSAFGQTAGTVGFQALIKDAEGNPIEVPVDLEFRIYDAEVAGNLVDMDGDGVVEDACGEDVTCVAEVTPTNGSVATKIGPIHPSAFDGNPRWLEVRVDTEPLSRVEMVTAPATSEQVNIPGSGTPAIQVDGSGNVGIGTDTPNVELEVVHIVRASRLTDAAQYVEMESPSGAANRVTGHSPESNKKSLLIQNVFDASGSPNGSNNIIFRNGSDASPTERMRIDEDGNVGIGTTNPGTKLDVVGTVTATSFVGDGSGLTGISGGDPSYGSSDGSPDDAVFVDDAGNVGIGTTNPERILHTVGDLVWIERDGNAPGIILENTSGGGSKAHWGLYSTGEGTARVQFSDETLATFVIYLTDGKMGVGGDAGAPANTLTVAGDADFTGNVGIGTTTPATELDVVGTATATAFVGDGSGLTGINVDDADADPANELQDLTGVLGQGNDAGGADMLNLGNVGIGTTTPTQKLSVFDGELVLQVANSANEQSILFQNPGSSYTWRLYRKDVDGFDADFHIAGGPALEDFNALPDRLTINAAGNVGIGTTEPSTKLEVAGTVTATAFSSASPLELQTAGTTRIYVDDGSGNVGIGTDSPGVKLVVAGEIRVQTKIRSSTGGLTLSGGGSGVRVELDEDGGSSDTFTISDTGVERFRVVGNTGNVGIGNSDPQQSLDVSGTIRSRSGGFKFPDGSVQTTAAASCSGVVIVKDLSVDDTTTVVCPEGMTIIKCVFGLSLGENEDNAKYRATRAFSGWVPDSSEGDACGWTALGSSEASLTSAGAAVAIIALCGCGG